MHQQHINDELTRAGYKGNLLQQREEVKDVFKTLFSNFKPKRIIEVGTGGGGLTMYIRDETKDYADVYSFDILETHYHVNVRNAGINFFVKNIFKEEVKNWNKYEVKEEWEYLFDISPKLVLVDGGNKKAEFNAIAKYLNVGDIIMLHDYSTDQTSFEQLKVWNWLECQYSNIKEECEAYNLKPFMNDEFLNVAWGCFKKYE
jgi:predicted O-methyltransferase YrrM